MTTCNLTAVSAYRTLLRAARIAFRGTLLPSLPSVQSPTAVHSPRIVRPQVLICPIGDIRLLTASFAQARQGFESNRSSSPEKIQEGVQHALEVARVLREHIVQGAKDPRGADKYQLRIHDEIERGSNESVKTGGVNMEGVMSGGCCRGEGGRELQGGLR